MLATSAPLLSKIREKGSTFYTFSSAINDIDKTLLNNNFKVAPSKFVCLNIPQWKRSSVEWSIFEEYENIGLPNQTDPNIVVPKVIQNYIENGLALHYNYRDEEQLQTITESLFWKAMLRMGGIDLLKDSEEIHNEIPYSIFKENISDHESMVKYIGDVNILNHVTKDGQSYSEVFLHVPHQASLLKDILWKDTGFELQQNYIPENGGPYYTVGLEDHPLENSKAIYDTDDNKYNFSNQLNRSGIYFDRVTYPDNNVVKEDFEFNAILLYYDIWSDTDKTYRATNLYGILFVNNFNDKGAGSFQIPTFEKVAPSKESTGNGFATRLIIKTTANTEQTTSEVTINDYSTVSMELYMNALQELNKVNAKYDKFISTYSDIDPKISQILGMLNRIEPNEELQKQITTIESQVKRNQKTARISNEDLFELFNRTINEIKTSATSNINVQYVSGNYYFDETDGMPIILDPDNKRWKWNPEFKVWSKLD